MRIGIITLPLNTNYGGILQAYALQTVLERLQGGHQVTVFDKNRFYRSSWKKDIFSYPVRFIQKYVLGWQKSIRWEVEWRKNETIMGQYTEPFINKYIHRKYCEDLSSLNANDYDAFVVGSDQIWRPMFYPKISDAYLKFAEGWAIKRIAYAPSFGTNNWEYSDEQTKECGRLLKMFDKVSVREKEGVSLCKKYFNVDAVHVLDPTMLLTSEDYEKLFRLANTPKHKGSLMTYVLDCTDSIIRMIDEISNSNGWTVFETNAKIMDSNAPIEERVQRPVEEWLRGFYDAEFVVTDSFHACVFSILFNKPFLVVGNKSRGMSRIESLLSLFGLESRIVYDNTNLSLNKIDWNHVNNKLTELRKESMKMFDILI